MLDVRSIGVTGEAQGHAGVTRKERVSVDAAAIIGAIAAVMTRIAAWGLSEVERRGAFDSLLSGLVQIILATLIVICGTAAMGLIWIALR